MIELASERILLREVINSSAVVFIELELLSINVGANVVVDTLYEAGVGCNFVLLPFLVDCVIEGQQYLQLVLEVAAEVLGHDPLIRVIVVFEH